MNQNMQNANDCGPSGVSRVTGKSIEEVKAKWPGGWKDHEDWRDDFNDWPDDHRLALASLGFTSAPVTLSDILDGRAPVGKTVVLLHFSDTKKHWVVLAGIKEGAWGFHWGDGTVRWLTRARLAELFTKSFPNCAYSVGTQPVKKLPWYRRVLGWFAGITGKF